VIVLLFVFALIWALVVAQIVVDVVTRRLKQPAPYRDTSRGTRR
jgi:hypothetical protein